jgi:hypothetical protein
MYNGEVKLVQEVCAGDLLMGDDSTPRTVLSTTRGQEHMFDIRTHSGRVQYTVNISHILTLKSQVLPIDDIRKYLDCSAHEGHTHGYFDPVAVMWRTMATRPVDDPVFDLALKEYLQLKWYQKHALKGFRVPVEWATEADEHALDQDPFDVGQCLAKNAFKSSRVPMAYKTGSWRQRQALLRGFDSVKIQYSYNEGLLEDLLFVRRSLGQAAMKYAIDVQARGHGEYYGFELDGNGRFLLGDFTVTHNTTIALNLACRLGVRTLIIVHKEFLADQWRERIERFVPQARIGRIQGPIVDIEDKDIVLGMLQSLSMRDYPAHVFEGFGFVAIDECLPYTQAVLTTDGPRNIGHLYNMWAKGDQLPDVASFNHETKEVEYKPITHAWKKTKEEVLEVKYCKSQLRCTDNHRLLTMRGYVAAKDVQPGDLLICSHDASVKESYVSPVLNDDQHQLLLGSFLGDGAVQILPSGRYRLKVIHGAAQHGYCKWKASMFGRQDVNFIAENGYASTPAYTFASRVLDLPLDKALPGRKGTCPQWVLDDMDARALAIWWMDDGTNFRTGGGGILFICAFDADSHARFVEAMWAKWRIAAQRHVHKTYEALKLNKLAFLRLCDVIAPYVHPSMMYKIDLQADTSYVWSGRFLGYGTVPVHSVKRIPYPDGRRRSRKRFCTSTRRSRWGCPRRQHGRTG